MTMTYGEILRYICDFLEDNHECPEHVRQAVSFCRERIEDNQTINSATDEDNCPLEDIDGPGNINLLNKLATLYQFDVERNVELDVNNVHARKNRISFQVFREIIGSTTITTSACFAFLATRPEHDALNNEFEQSRARYNKNNVIRKKIAAILTHNEIRITPYQPNADLTVHKTAILSCLKTSPHLTSLFNDAETKIGKRPTSSEQLVIRMRERMSFGAST